MPIFLSISLKYFSGSLEINAFFSFLKNVLLKCEQTDISIPKMNCQFLLTLWLTFSFEDDYLAFFYKAVCRRSSVADVVSIFRWMRHVNVCVRVGELDVVFVDGEPQGAIVDPLGNINGYWAGKLELVLFKYLSRLYGQPWLWKQLCWK